MDQRQINDGSGTVWGFWLVSDSVGVGFQSLKKKNQKRQTIDYARSDVLNI